MADAQRRHEPAATLPGRSRTIVVEPLERPREAPRPAPVEPDPERAPVRPAEEPEPVPA